MKSTTLQILKGMAVNEIKKTRPHMEAHGYLNYRTFISWCRRICPVCIEVQEGKYIGKVIGKYSNGRPFQFTVAI